MILIVSLFQPSSLSIKAQNIPRYKIVVQVALGEMREQGVRVASRCLWDPVTDNHASAAFTNVRSKSKMLQLFFHDIDLPIRCCLVHPPDAPTSLDPQFVLFSLTGELVVHRLDFCPLYGVREEERGRKCLCLCVDAYVSIARKE